MNDWIVVLTNENADTYVYLMKNVEDGVEAKRRIKEFVNNFVHDKIVDSYALPINDLDEI